MSSKVVNTTPVPVSPSRKLRNMITEKPLPKRIRKYEIKEESSADGGQADGRGENIMKTVSRTQTVRKKQVDTILSKTAVQQVNGKIITSSAEKRKSSRKLKVDESSAKGKFDKRRLSKPIHGVFQSATSPPGNTLKSDKPSKKRSKKKIEPGITAKTSSAGPPLNDIASMLRIGEGSRVNKAVDSEESDWEAVDVAPCQRDLVTKGFVEITLPSNLPLQKTKKKKEVDLEGFVKREISKAQRELQLLIHQTHLLCLYARTLQINASLNSHQLLAVAMSMLPSRYAYPPNKVTTSYLEAFATWFTVKIKLDTASDGNSLSESDFGQVLHSRLMMRKARCDIEYVCLFVLILRAIGVDCRLVVSLQPVPIKPTVSITQTVNLSKSNSCQSGKASAAKSKQSVKAGNVAVGRTEKKVSTDLTEANARASTGKRRSSVRTPKNRVKYNGQSSDDDEEDAGLEKSRSSRRRSAAATLQGKHQPPKSTADPAAASLQESSSSSGRVPVGSEQRDYWAEVYVEQTQRWVPVDIVGGGKVDAVKQIRKHSTSLVYVVGWDNQGHVKDVTARYDPKWQTSTRRLRVRQDWWEDVIMAWKGVTSARDRKEDQNMQQDLEERPIPQAISEFKNHPLYALKRHLLKFESIYPPSSAPLGFIGKGDKKEAVYARECVVTLRSRETWLKEARVVRPDEVPYNVVKARAKWDRVLQRAITDKPLEVFGRWQTADYEPPVAKDGKVPRNPYGNVELYKPTMLPVGTVHLPVDGLSRVARKLDIDIAPAMVGWDFHGGGSHPVFQGHVVCQEFEDVLMDAWREEQREARRREIEKREKRILVNWKRLIRGLMIKKKLAAKYDFSEEPPKKKARAKQVKEKSTVSVPKTVSASRKKVPDLVEMPTKEEPKVELSKEETARKVEACIAGMSFTKVALSSDSEEDDDDKPLQLLKKPKTEPLVTETPSEATEPAVKTAKRGPSVPRKRKKPLSTGVLLKEVQRSETAGSAGTSRTRRSCTRVVYREGRDSDEEPWMENYETDSDNDDKFKEPDSSADDDFED